MYTVHSTFVHIILYIWFIRCSAPHYLSMIWHRIVNTSIPNLQSIRPTAICSYTADHTVYDVRTEYRHEWPERQHENLFIPSISSCDSRSVFSGISHHSYALHFIFIILLLTDSARRVSPFGSDFFFLLCRSAKSKRNNRPTINRTFRLLLLLLLLLCDSLQYYLILDV